MNLLLSKYFLVASCFRLILFYCIKLLILFAFYLPPFWIIYTYFLMFLLFLLLSATHLFVSILFLKYWVTSLPLFYLLDTCLIFWSNKTLLSVTFSKNNWGIRLRYNDRIIKQQVTIFSSGGVGYLLITERLSMLRKIRGGWMEEREFVEMV